MGVGLSNMNYMEILQKWKWGFRLSTKTPVSRSARQAGLNHPRGGKTLNEVEERYFGNKLNREFCTKL